MTPDEALQFANDAEPDTGILTGHKRQGFLRSLHNVTPTAAAEAMARTFQTNTRFSVAAFEKQLGTSSVAAHETSHGLYPYHLPDCICTGSGWLCEENGQPITFNSRGMTYTAAKRCTQGHQISRQTYDTWRNSARGQAHELKYGSYGQ